MQLQRQLAATFQTTKWPMLFHAKPLWGNMVNAISCHMVLPTAPLVPQKVLVLRRLSALVPAFLLLAVGVYLAWNMAGGWQGLSASPLNIALFGIFVLLFGMLSFTSWAMTLGLLLGLAGRRRTPLEREALAIPAQDLKPSTTTRTALLIPAYHENPHEVFARVRTMRAALAALQPEASPSDIDIFILSDSQNPQAMEEEAQAYQSLMATLPSHGPAVYYRRRTDNVDYKVGNIKEFCTRWGGAYDYMLVLDADSLMSGETIRRMIALMERHPRIGLLQTSFMPVGRETLFCRVMQFSARLYMRPASLGLEFWQGANANYWGHNALLRTKAFLETCGLPTLPGKAPLGGRVLSHDIVEAALIARGGWEAWLLPTLEGTYEELPTNMIDYMQRDRRWCAGNLQHQHFIRADGVPFVNRLHMVLGIMSYATGPLWLLFVLLSIVAMLLTGGDTTTLNLATAGLMGDTEVSETLFVYTIILLFGPKVLTLGIALVHPRLRRSFGGARPLLESALLEQAFGMLMQPAAMVFYTSFVIMPLLGRVVKWEAQPRSERGIGWREGVLRHRKHLMLGAALLAIMTVVPGTASKVWLSPIVVSLLVSPAFTVLTSRISLGRALRRGGLFLTVDERTPCLTLESLHRKLASPLPPVEGLRTYDLPPESPASMPLQALRYPKKPKASPGHGASLGGAVPDHL